MNLGKKSRGARTVPNRADGLRTSVRHGAYQSGNTTGSVVCWSIEASSKDRLDVLFGRGPLLHGCPEQRLVGRYRHPLAEGDELKKRECALSSHILEHRLSEGNVLWIRQGYGVDGDL